MPNNLVLSSLPHTWIFDVDGTICVHNGYKNGGDVILEGVKELFSQIPDDDMIILLTRSNKRMVFNEDTRVKIPAILTLTRLG